MNRGKLQKLDSPENLIRELGAFAVDEDEESIFFQNREDAISYLRESKNDCALRTTTLEDVFVKCAGQKLER